MLQALLTISNLPFHLANEFWRWKVFRDEVPTDQWNEFYWDLTKEYAGFEAPVERSKEDFDAHVFFDIGEDWEMMRYVSK